MPVNRYRQRDEVLRSLGFPSYAAYLKSPLWARIKRKVFENCNTCVCGQPATQAHHRSYKRQYLLGKGQWWRFIVPVCRKCHRHIEFDNTAKTSLGRANHRLDQIAERAQFNGIVVKHRKPRRKKTRGNQPGSRPKRRQENKLTRSAAIRDT